MPATIIRRTETGFTVSVDVPYKGSMLDAEEAIQTALNEAGVAATAEALTRFDADCDIIIYIYILYDKNNTQRGAGF